MLTVFLFFFDIRGIVYRENRQKPSIESSETFEGGRLTKETSTTTMDSVTDPILTCEFLVKNNIGPLPRRLIHQIYNCELPSLIQAENAAQKLPKSRANRRRTSTRLRKTTSKSGRNGGTCVLLRKVIISKEMVLKLR